MIFNKKNKKIFYYLLIIFFPFFDDYLEITGVTNCESINENKNIEDEKSSQLFENNEKESFVNHKYILIITGVIAFSIFFLYIYPETLTYIQNFFVNETKNLDFEKIIHEEIDKYMESGKSASFCSRIGHIRKDLTFLLNHKERFETLTENELHTLIEKIINESGKGG